MRSRCYFNFIDIIGGFGGGEGFDGEGGGESGEGEVVGLAGGHGRYFQDDDGVGMVV